MFNVETHVNHITNWIRDWFDQYGTGCPMCVGISGGKDSAVVATLGARALGSNRVIGILLPDGEQVDIDDSIEICKHLGIKYETINIADTVDAVLSSLYPAVKSSRQAAENLPPRIRMATLYAYSQSINGRVSCNCNLSEDYIGYSTVYGDDAGDFRPLAEYTATEVLEMVRYLALPSWLYTKAPADGLCGKTDEDNLGFSYSVLDAYLRDHVMPEAEIVERIESMHRRNAFKLEPRKSCPYLLAV